MLKGTAMHSPRCRCQGARGLQLQLSKNRLSGLVPCPKPFVKDKTILVWETLKQDSTSPKNRLSFFQKGLNAFFEIIGLEEKKAGRRGQ